MIYFLLFNRFDHLIKTRLTSSLITFHRTDRLSVVFYMFKAQDFVWFLCYQLIIHITELFGKIVHEI